MGRGRWGELAGLVWRDDCLSCGRVTVDQAVVGLCRGCAVELRRVPTLASGSHALPVYAAGAYGGAHRGVVLAAKEHLRPEAVQVAGAVIAGVIRHLVAQGLLGDPRLAPLVLLPAPTTRTAARDRGGCVVTGAATVAARQLNAHGRAGSADSADSGAQVVAAATLGPGAQDSVGLSRAQRQGNIVGNLRVDARGLAHAVRALRVPGATACIVDDVLTTGATLSGFSAALAAHGVEPSAAVVIAQA